MSRPPLPENRRRPHPARLQVDPAWRDVTLAAHEAALAVGHPTYVDPRTGLSVMTAQSLWDRGTCCDTGCRHCPYLAR